RPASCWKTIARTSAANGPSGSRGRWRTGPTRATRSASTGSLAATSSIAVFSELFAIRPVRMSRAVRPVPRESARRVGSGSDHRHGGLNVSAPASPLLSPSQLAALAAIGEERSAAVGEKLYGVGDRTYPFIAILEGEVAIVDAAGNEIIRHRPSGFLGELNL